MSNTSLTINHGSQFYYGDSFTIFSPTDAEKATMVVISGPSTFTQRVKLAWKVLRGLK